MFSLFNKDPLIRVILFVWYIFHWEFQEPGPERLYASFTIKVNLFLDISF